LDGALPAASRRSSRHLGRPTQGVTIPGVRLNRYLAQCGVASRRAAEEQIARGFVSINGDIVRKLATIVHAGDRVEVKGNAVAPPLEATYLLLNKPSGVVTTMRDPEGRRTVADLLPDSRRVVPVGRLDYATTGVLLLTDDGELAHRLLHPRYGVDKTYRATIAGRLSPADVGRLSEGISLGDFRASGAQVRVVARQRDRSIVDVTIHEGQNRQVRRMFEALGHPVLALTRTRFGPLRLGGLPAGHVRSLTGRERAALERHRRPMGEPPRSNSKTETTTTRAT
jgi:23S rRNA pseudouridine2605 synthase